MSNEYALLVYYKSNHDLKPITFVTVVIDDGDEVYLLADLV
jgi:hypothetical protein